MIWPFNKFASRKKLNQLEFQMEIYRICFLDLTIVVKELHQRIIKLEKLKGGQNGCTKNKTQRIRKNSKKR